MLRSALVGLASAAVISGGLAPIAAQTDLDAFMKRVVSRRDDNWQKLQQYILDESEVSEVRGPGGALVWGGRYEYTWFLRDGMFVRSPLKANGVTIGEADRRKEEDDYVRRERRRAERAAEAKTTVGQASADSPADPADGDGLVTLTGPGRTPEFITSAYFLRFNFDEGRYALVGRETLENREVLRIEYYPTSLFRESERRERQREDGDPAAKPNERSEQYRRAVQRLMNKTSLVTLWIDPKTEQILKYVFDNVNLEFLPGQWLLQVDDIDASMTMGQAFPDVWLPRHLSMDIAVTSAAGRFDFRYTLDYHDYRQADVTSKVGFPDAR